MIKMIVLDVDGTLTDGKIYMGENGEVMKAFNCHDAVGVRKLKKNNILSVIITGRESKIVLNRAKEMNIDFVYQNIHNKKEKLDQIVVEKNINYDEILYIGDDINDLECIKICGHACCPNDAVDIIKENCDYISKFNAGEGVVRDVIDLLLNGYFEKKNNI